MVVENGETRADPRRSGPRLSYGAWLCLTFLATTTVAILVALGGLRGLSYWIDDTCAGGRLDAGPIRVLHHYFIYADGRREDFPDAELSPGQEWPVGIGVRLGLRQGCHCRDLKAEVLEQKLLLGQYFVPSEFGGAELLPAGGDISTLEGSWTWPSEEKAQLELRVMCASTPTQILAIEHLATVKSQP
jgi:hypothetical protein